VADTDEEVQDLMDPENWSDEDAYDRWVRTWVWTAGPVAALGLVSSPDADSR
jgi:hypothetical protein